jgi:hypothetical protein
VTLSGQVPGHMDEICSLRTKDVKMCCLVRDIIHIRGWRQVGMEQQLNDSLEKPKELGAKPCPLPILLQQISQLYSYNKTNKMH